VHLPDTCLHRCKIEPQINQREGALNAGLAEFGEELAAFLAGDRFLSPAQPIGGKAQDYNYFPMHCSEPEEKAALSSGPE
jgi:hypothetical protein